MGASLAVRLATQGTRVAILGRRAEALAQVASGVPDRLFPVIHDVTHLHEVPALFQRVTGDLGGLDLIVYAAGTMPPVGPLEFTPATTQELLATNLIGATAWLDEAATRFAGTRHGTLAAIGSVSGDRGRRLNPGYHAAKAGLATYLESLRNRLSEQGVTVTTFKPGPVDTPMTRDYAGKKMPLDAATELLYRNLGAGREVYFSPVHRLAFAVIRNLPTGVMRRLRM